MSLLRAAATVSSFTLLSRVTGLLRDIIIARAFGAGALTPPAGAQVGQDFKIYSLRTQYAF